MPKLTCTRGLPGSGKSTWAMNELRLANPGTLACVSRDDLRSVLHGQHLRIHEAEEQVTRVHHAAVAELLRVGVDVIVHDTLFPIKHLRPLAKIAWKFGAVFAVQDFTHVPLEECIARDARRTGPDRVGEDVIRMMHARYLKGKKLPLAVPSPPDSWATGAPYVPDPALPAAVMVDVDGTVALHNGRSPHDYERCGEDLPNPGVVAAVHAAAGAGYRIVYCSGRPERCREATMVWLWKHVGVPFEGLYMRPTEDKDVRDDEVKLKLFDKYIRDYYRVVWVFDDRDRVVAAWRSIGLTVMQVNYGDF